MSIDRFEDIDVWKQAREFADKIYNINYIAVHNFP
jgi:hypothetical protein